MPAPPPASLPLQIVKDCLTAGKAVFVESLVSRQRAAQLRAEGAARHAAPPRVAVAATSSASAALHVRIQKHPQAQRLWQDEAMATDSLLDGPSPPSVQERFQPADLAELASIHQAAGAANHQAPFKAGLYLRFDSGGQGC